MKQTDADRELAGIPEVVDSMIAAMRKEKQSQKPPPRPADQELTVMSACLEMLQGLPDLVRWRVFAWLRARLEEDFRQEEEKCQQEEK